MRFFRLKDLLTVIGLYQIIAGVFMIISLIRFIVMYPFEQISSGIFLGLIFTALTIYAGIKLLLVKKKMDLRSSVINQALQVIQLKAYGYGLLYYSGLYLGVGIIWFPQLEWYIKGDVWGFQCLLNINSGELDSFVLVNLFAITILGLLLLLAPTIKSNES